MFLTSGQKKLHCCPTRHNIMAKTDSFTGAVEKALAKGQLSPAERKAAERLAQLSPAERKIQRELDRKRIADQQKSKPKPKPKPNTNLSGPKPNTNLSGPRPNTNLTNPTPRAGGGGGEMRKVKGRVINPAADDVAKGVSKGVGKGVLKGIGKIAVPLAAAEQAYQTGMLIGSEEARDRATQEYEDMADDNALMRAGKGALGGVTTIYGFGSNVGKLGESVGEAVAARQSYEKREKELAKDPKYQAALQSMKDIQAAYADLSKEERRKVDQLGGAGAKKYLEELVAANRFVGPPKPDNLRPTATRPTAPASSEPAPPSSPATAGAQQSPMERRMTALDAQVAAAPKARIIDEPVDEDRAMALFQNTHGGPFDPKSSMDRVKMTAIKSLMAQKGSERLTPNQFSLKLYRMS